VKLISLWDYQLILEPLKVENLIRRKLNVTERVGARKTIKKTITANEAYRFYLINHFDGTTQEVYYKGNVHLGLFLDGVMVMCTSYSDKKVIRICTLPKYCVVGGLSRLLHQVKSGCVFFSVNDMGGGSGLVGFKQQPYTTLRYVWVKGLEVLSRYSCQKHRISKRFGIDMNGHTEESAMVSLGYNKCFDSGLSKWVRIC